MSKTLLLADDSVTIQKVVGISFANEDVTLVTVDNGDAAVERVREVRPDVVLADVVMPGKSGYEVCEAIKADAELSETPVLLLTGTFEAFDEERATAVGADGHITKPFEAQALVDRVNALLARRAAPVAAPAPEPPPIAAAPVAAALPEADPGATDPNAQSYDFFEEAVTEPEPEASTPNPAAATPPSFAFDADPQVPTPSPDETMVMPAGVSFDTPPPPPPAPVEASPEPDNDLTMVAEPIADAVSNGDTFPTAPPAPPSQDPLETMEPAGPAGHAVLDPAGGRAYDVSSTDLGETFRSAVAEPVSAPEEITAPEAPEPPPFEAAFEATPEPVAPPVAAAPAASLEETAPELGPVFRQELRDAIEKIAWEAFGQVTEKLVQDAVERVEKVAWEVVPQMAETLVKEEIRKMKGD